MQKFKRALLLFTYGMAATLALPVATLYGLVLYVQTVAKYGEKLSNQLDNGE